MILEVAIVYGVQAMRGLQEHDRLKRSSDEEESRDCVQCDVVDLAESICLQ